ncbi:Vegetative incompatibility protein HET-E-1 [Trametes pubescens]|uniref:Vegetative incompatibility protein HET-E-1 n=1 Tax=Trametes pubescens TaxID=154538 RepID=A0A1M2W6Y7_TRAPU|nr:Vegetative incompatibility protein HET-E-1 [Trametes pubescens]
MWLLNTSTYQLLFRQDPSRVHYAILSHVWDLVGEQTFQDVQAIHASARNDFPDAPEDGDPRLLRNRLGAKIWCGCDYARARGYPYLWIDSCCIDKTSSAELSEAINSMFDWYSQAAVCYVFLFDVSAGDRPAAKDSSFRRSMWFKRGWTLQELIVPSRDVFLSKDWRMIGTKAGLASVIEDATKINVDVLPHRRQLHTVSVAERMAWASGRETTRVEDEAYCLMGIFGVRLPVIYGEGSQAFARLQEVIMRRIRDQSLLAWGIESDSVHCISPKGFWPCMTSVPTDKLRASKTAYLFASSARDFRRSSGLSPIPLDTFASILELSKAIDPPLYTPSGYGVRTTFPVCTLRCPTRATDDCAQVHLAILACEDVYGRLPTLLLHLEGVGSQCLIGGFEFIRTPELGPPSARKPSSSVLQASRRGSTDFTTADMLYIQFKGLCKIILPCWTLEHLGALGVSVNGAVEDGEMVPVSLSLRQRHGNPRGAQWYHNFTLTHGGDARGAITVAVFTCPSSDYLGPLHASVVWGSEYGMGISGHR